MLKTAPFLSTILYYTGRLSLSQFMNIVFASFLTIDEAIITKLNQYIEQVNFQINFQN